MLLFARQFGCHYPVASREVSAALIPKRLCEALSYARLIIRRRGVTALFWDGRSVVGESNKACSVDFTDLCRSESSGHAFFSLTG